MRQTRNSDKKKKYLKPKIKYKSDKRPIVVAVSCQKIFGESDVCGTEIEI